MFRFLGYKPFVKSLVKIPGRRRKTFLLSLVIYHYFPCYEYIFFLTKLTKMTASTYTEQNKLEFWARGIHWF
jgi:hypothetical protein